MKKYENEDRIANTIGSELSDNDLNNVSGGAGDGNIPASRWNVKIMLCSNIK